MLYVNANAFAAQVKTIPTKRRDPDEQGRAGRRIFVLPLREARMARAISSPRRDRRCLVSRRRFRRSCCSPAAPGCPHQQIFAASTRQSGNT